MAQHEKVGGTINGGTIFAVVVADILAAAWGAALVWHWPEYAFFEIVLSWLAVMTLIVSVGAFAAVLPPNTPRHGHLMGAINMEKPRPRWVAEAIKAVIGLAALAFVIVFVVLPTMMRDGYYKYYTSRLDDWVAKGGDAHTVQTQVVETCGKLIMSQAGIVERFQLVTFYRDEFDFRVDVCTKMTANRIYKQPEFEKPEVVAMICDDPHPFHELFGRLCRRSGLRPAQ
jgi:hypothetical protein